MATAREATLGHGPDEERPHLDIAFESDPGRERKLNEDSVYCEPPDSPYVEARGVLCAVADGMGGHNAGEIASHLAIQTARDAYYYSTEPNPLVALRQAIESAHREVAARATDNPSQSGMGSTLTVVIIHGWSLLVGHVGDSRAYLVRDGALRQLVADDSWVGQQRGAGVLTSEEARVHPQRNVLTQAVGHGSELSVQIVHESLRNGDRLVLCSDGLHGPVSDDVIARTVQKESPLRAVKSLVRLANEAGGNDNISVVIVEVGTPRAALSVPAGILRPRSAWLPLTAASGVLMLLLIILVLRESAASNSSQPPPTQLPTPMVALATVEPTVNLTIATSTLPMGALCFPLPSTGRVVPDGARVRPRPETTSTPIPTPIAGGTLVQVQQCVRGQTVAQSWTWFQVTVTSSAVTGFMHCSGVMLEGSQRQDSCDIVVPAE